MGATRPAGLQPVWPHPQPMPPYPNQPPCFVESPPPSRCRDSSTSSLQNRRRFVHDLKNLTDFWTNRITALPRPLNHDDARVNEVRIIHAFPVGTIYPHVFQVLRTRSTSAISQY